MVEEDVVIRIALAATKVGTVFQTTNKQLSIDFWVMQETPPTGRSLFAQLKSHSILLLFQ